MEEEENHVFLLPFRKFMFVSPLHLPLLFLSNLNQRRDVPLNVSSGRSQHKPLSVLSPWWGCILFAAFSLSLPLPAHVWFSPLEQDLDQPLSLLAPYFLSRAGGCWAEWCSQSWDLPHLPWPPSPHCSTHGGVSHKGIFFIALTCEGRFSRCVTVPLASCDPVSQQILSWLWRICFGLSKFILKY